MADKIYLRAGNAENMPELADREIAFVRDEKALFIGTPDGNLKLCSADTEEMVEELGEKIKAIEDSAVVDVSFDSSTNKIQKKIGETTSDVVGLSKVATTGSYSDLSNKPTIPAAVIVDSALSSTSTNPVQNKVVNTALNNKLDKLTIDVRKAINFGSTGLLYVGKFGVYDSQVTIEITSTTSVTYSGKLVIATQNYVIKQAAVYGDAANTIAPNIYIKPSTTSDRFIEVYFQPAKWSKNVVHLYGSAVSSVESACQSVTSLPETATVKPTNALTSNFAKATELAKKLTATPAAAQAELEAEAELAAVVSAYNSLIAALKAGGIMNSE